MNKKVLAIYYSQSGQLGEIIDNLILPIRKAGTHVECIRINPVQPYPFPWNGKQFFSVMPDCVLDVPTDLGTIQFQEKKYDLIILGYQAWFLSPSIPVNSLLQIPAFKGLLKNTPVVTVTGARNMWISAFERIKKSLHSSGARLSGNIALVDHHHNLVSFITIFQWMFKGRKERYLGIFPKPGVSDQDIKDAGIFGKIIQRHLAQDEWNQLQTDLLKEKAVEVKYKLMYIENTASRLFYLWAKFIAKRKKRTFWLVLFKYYLLIALFIAAPVILTVDAVFIKPFSARKIKDKLRYYSGVN